VGRSPQKLALDPTAWKFALIDIELLTFWIAHQGAAYPTVWLTLSKAGNSSTDERIALMEIFIDLFDKDRIKSLTDHREFVGEQWLLCLRNQGFDFRMRTHETYRIANRQGRLAADWRLFAKIRGHTALAISPPRRTRSGDRRSSGRRLGIGECQYIVTPKFTETAVADYVRLGESKLPSRR